jgi:hypothetical protein
MVMSRQLVVINYSNMKDGKTFHHGKLIYFNYEVGQTLNGEVLNWNGDNIVAYIVESKETLEKQQLLVHEIKVLSLELSMIRLSTIKCKLDKITIEINKRDTFKEWRSSIIGRMSITIKKFENEIYHVELYRNITLMNLVALMILTKTKIFFLHLKLSSFFTSLIVKIKIKKFFLEISVKLKFGEMDFEPIFKGVRYVVGVS